MSGRDEHPRTTIGSPAIGGYSNTYTGPTVVNQGTLSVGGTLGSIQIPGDLIINGNTSTTATTVTQTTVGTIAPTSNVTINGNGLPDTGRQQHAGHDHVQ